MPTQSDTDVEAAETCWVCYGTGNACWDCWEPGCSAATPCRECGATGTLSAGSSMRENHEPAPEPYRG